MKDDDDENQLINYLKATTIEVGYFYFLQKTRINKKNM